MRHTRDGLEIGMAMRIGMWLVGALWRSSLDQIEGVSCLSISLLKLTQSLPLLERCWRLMGLLVGLRLFGCRLEGQTNALTTSDRQGLRWRQGLTDCC